LEEPKFSKPKSKWEKMLLQRMGFVSEFGGVLPIFDEVPLYIINHVFMKIVDDAGKLPVDDFDDLLSMTLVSC
jgi:hypothetical protein